MVFGQTDARVSPPTHSLWWWQQGRYVGCATSGPSSPAGSLAPAEKDRQDHLRAHPLSLSQTQHIRPQAPSPPIRPLQTSCHPWLLQLAEAGDVCAGGNCRADRSPLSQSAASPASPALGHSQALGPASRSWSSPRQSATKGNGSHLGQLVW